MRLKIFSHVLSSEWSLNVHLNSLSGMSARLCARGPLNFEPVDFFRGIGPMWEDLDEEIAIGRDIGMVGDWTSPYE